MGPPKVGKAQVTPLLPIFATPVKTRRFLNVLIDVFGVFMNQSPYFP